MSATMKDSEGAEVRDGDIISFCFGIPPVGVEARIIERGGKLIALTPPHKPSECELSKLKRHVGDFYKVETRAAKPLEIEAAIFASRLSPKPRPMLRRPPKIAKGTKR